MKRIALFAALLATQALDAVAGNPTPYAPPYGAPMAGHAGDLSWLHVPSGPYGLTHPATSVFAERCCSEHYPGCCENVWDTYCQERTCWHEGRGCRDCAPGRFGRGWPSGGWGWNPGWGPSVGAVTTVDSASPVTAYSTVAPAAAPPSSVPEAPVPPTPPNLNSPASEQPAVDAPQGGEEPSAWRWRGYPHVSSRTSW